MKSQGGLWENTASQSHDVRPCSSGEEKTQPHRSIIASKRLVLAKSVTKKTGPIYIPWFHWEKGCVRFCIQYSIFLGAGQTQSKMLYTSGLFCKNTITDFSVVLNVTHKIPFYSKCFVGSRFSNRWDWAFIF